MCLLLRYFLWDVKKHDRTESVFVLRALVNTVMNLRFQ